MNTKGPTKVEWSAWAAEDPLYGAATWPGHQRGGQQAWTDEAFYDSGRSDWGEFARRWQGYGLNIANCVEIGCGAGRLTKHMAETFGHVYAIDVSPGMIGYAKRHVQAGNVSFLVTNGRTIPLKAGTVSAAFSNHAFHHFDSVAEGERYFEEISRTLAEDGSLMINLDLHEFPAFISLQRRVYSLVRRVGDLRAAARRWRLQQGNGTAFMRFTSYEISWMFTTLARLGFTDPEVSIFPVPSPLFERPGKHPGMRLHSFVFARKGRG